MRALLAGRHDRPRPWRSDRAKVRGRSPSEPETRACGRPPRSAPAPARALGDDRRIGYVRQINDSLGSNDLIRVFDAALAGLRDTAGLVLDLRDTPGGGNSTVARGIMGRFLVREGSYQKHSIPAEEREFGVRRSWVEIVSPRGDFRYDAPVVVLVDHWTGSMGEGIAIGMDGLKRATVVGTEMAGLLGATGGITLPNSKIGVNFPVEKLFHVDGTPRETFVPPVYVNVLKGDAKAHDAILERGLEKLRALVKARGTR